MKRWIAQDFFLLVMVSSAVSDQVGLANQASHTLAGTPLASPLQTCQTTLQRSVANLDTCQTHLAQIAVASQQDRDKQLKLEDRIQTELKSLSFRQNGNDVVSNEPAVQKLLFSPQGPQGKEERKGDVAATTETATTLKESNRWGATRRISVSQLRDQVNDLKQRLQIAEAVKSNALKREKEAQHKLALMKNVTAMSKKKKTSESDSNKKNTKSRDQVCITSKSDSKCSFEEAPASRLCRTTMDLERSKIVGDMCT